MRPAKIFSRAPAVASAAALRFSPGALRKERDPPVRIVEDRGEAGEQVAPDHSGAAVAADAAGAEADLEIAEAAAAKVQPGDAAGTHGEGSSGALRQLLFGLAAAKQPLALN